MASLGAVAVLLLILFFMFFLLACIALAIVGSVWHMNTSNQQPLLANGQLDRAASASPEDLKKWRFVAHLHNCCRYNKMSVLKFTNKDFHDTITKPGRYWYFAVLFTLFAVGLFPYVYLNCTRTKGDLAEWLRQPFVSVPFGISFGILTFIISCLIQYFVGPWAQSQACDQSPRCQQHQGYKYARVFQIYTYAFKIWQSVLIVPHAPALIYSNYCLWQVNKAHVGVFVVGVAVNIIQMVVVAFLFLAICHIYMVFQIPELIISSAVADIGVALAVSMVVARFALYLMNFVLGQSAEKIALIDLAIQKFAIDKNFDNPLIFQDMAQHKSLALSFMDFQKLIDVDTWGHLGHDHNPLYQDHLPSSTCVRYIFIMEDDGTWTKLDVAYGKRTKEYR